jgi:hypothetical protein
MGDNVLMLRLHENAAQDPTRLKVGCKFRRSRHQIVRSGTEDADEERVFFCLHKILKNVLRPSVNSRDSNSRPEWEKADNV